MCIRFINGIAFACDRNCVDEEVDMVLIRYVPRKTMIDFNNDQIVLVTPHSCAKCNTATSCSDLVISK